MNDAERDQLAQRLSAMSLKDARSEIRKVDPAADMKYFRNAIWDEYHTLFLLPNAEISVTLVEKVDTGPSDSTDHTRPRTSAPTLTRATYTYESARVAPLDSRRNSRG